MALASTSILECNPSATANNVNGGWFNYANANFITNYAATLANTAAPVITSATYTFVAGDVNAWVYVQSGVSWTPGFYKISAVASGAATLNATIGAAVQLVDGVWIPSTVVGCATIAAPTGGVVGIDYSRGTAAILADTDLACADGDVAGAVVTSALKPFGPNHIGNHMKVTAGTGYTVNWYELVNVVGVEATLDRAVGTDGAKTGGTFYLGGALSFVGTGAGATEDAVTEACEAGQIVYFKAGTYTLGSWLSTAKDGTQALPIKVIGYNSVRGDRPTGDNRPFIDFGAGGAWTPGDFWHIYNLRTTGTVAAGLFQLTGTAIVIHNCKAINKGTSTGCTGIASQYAQIVNCEAVAYKGTGITVYGGTVVNCYIHSSDIGVKLTSTSNTTFVNNIISDCVTVSVDWTATCATWAFIAGNTISGWPTSKLGIGWRTSAAATQAQHSLVMNNIFYGLATAISLGTDSKCTEIIQNNFYNNTAGLVNCSKGTGNIALDPQFANLSEVTGTNATISGTTFASSGADFSSVVAGRDFVYLVSGTGVGGAVTAGIYGISTVGAGSLVLDVAPGDSAVADHVFKIVIGKNFSVGNNMKNAGLGMLADTSLFTQYLDLGALQSGASGGAGKAGLGPYKF